MKYTKVNDRYVIKLEKGEEVFTTLTSLCRQNGIKNGVFTGIGAVKGLSCGYYALDEKKYHFTQYDDLVEVVSLTGNIMSDADVTDIETLFVHAHGVFTGHDNRAFGGHIEKMSVGITLEIILEVLPSEITRSYDERIGLFLLDCGGE